MKFGLSALLFFMCSLSLSAQLEPVGSGSSRGVCFQKIKIVYDRNDPVSVKTTVQLFAKDVQAVTGTLPDVRTDLADADILLIAGTLDANQWIKKLAAEGKIWVDSLRNQWERYGVFLINHPFRGVKRALIIAGSDRRAVSYGLFAVSEAIGVSPWYWWADVPIKKNRSVCLQVHNYISPAPSVRFRGLFINDEDWGLTPWAKKTYDKQLGDIGPKTYARVFELLLRLKANYLCPAMHPASGAFNKYPENKVLADSFGIVMGSTHPEPLLFNNASEWDRKKMGEWDYMTNRKNILAVLDKRVRENAKYENVYTLALRGLHDKEMSGNYSLSDRLQLVDQAINDQRAILKKYINKPLDEIPQIFVPYKEVLGLYNAGLKLPEEVTIVWPDDNYGYMKQLSNEAEQKRSGHSGVYYHASYLGSPHDYLWLGSTPPNLMYEELSKAYATGADRVWLLNAGDIKSCEAPVTQFLSMAYNIKSFNFGNVPDFQAVWLSKIYGSEYYNAIKDITTAYNRLAFSRKPEFMGWGYEWNSNSHARERTTGTAFSFDHYGEAVSRINDFKRIEAEAEAVWRKLPENERPSFFQLVLYPVKGAGLMNRMWLTAQLQRQYVFEQRAAANDLKEQVAALHDSLQMITDMYNRLLNGKWDKVMSLHQGITASYYEKPKLDSVKLPVSGVLKVKCEGVQTGNGALLTFSDFKRKSRFFEMFNTGQRSVEWNATASDPWILLNRKKGVLSRQDTVWVQVDWSKIRPGAAPQGIITVRTKNTAEKILVTLFSPDGVTDSLSGQLVEYNGVVSIPAAAFRRKSENEQIKMEVIDQLGYEGQSVMMGSPTAPIQNAKRSDAPNLQYDFYTWGCGRVEVYTYVLPTFPLNSNRDFGFHESSNEQTTYGVSIDDGAITFPTSSAPEYSQTWSENVLRNAAVTKSSLYIDKPGKHTLKVICGDPGIVVQKIVMDLGGMSSSYLGPPPTIK